MHYYKKSQRNQCGSSEDEQQKPFWRQSNQEFLAERKRNGTGVFHPRETRTCFKCTEAGHIASNCPENIKTKQGVSQKLKEKVVDSEPPTEKPKVFENSTFEVGECSTKKRLKDYAGASRLVIEKQESASF
ncbi:putative transcription factor interactor and regulator CCHC(Zn) family [Helianthus annuus]|nr:putative transcription factor interactor and regulator CCHC(Zn) family [Helianthus annuus]